MSSTNHSGLLCQGLCKTYQTRNGSIPAIQGVSFCVKEGEFVCIVGPSGCGKTTLLKLIAGLLEPTSGQILFNQDSQDGLPRSALVFQEHGLFPWKTVRDNVAFGLEMQGKAKKERWDLSRSYIEKVGLLKFINNYPHELSVGMRQRVGIARAFVSNAQILLMDEPFGSLDAQTKLILQEELLKIWREDQKCVVYITHDLEEAVFLGDRVLVMTARPGYIRDEIHIPFNRPRDLSIKELIDFSKMKRSIWRTLEEEVRKSCG